MKEYNIFTKEMIVKKTFRVVANSKEKAIKKFLELDYNCGYSLGEDNIGKWEVESVLEVTDKNYSKLNKLKRKYVEVDC
jgi:hypothetical protein